MHACTTHVFKVKNFYLPPLLFITSVSIVGAIGSTYVITPSIINSGGGITSSLNYSTHYSLGQLGAGSYSSLSYQIQMNSLSIPDTDNDGILDNIDNCLSVSNASQLNTDFDLLGNSCDSDDDNDGLSDAAEAILGTNPLLVDTDGDGLSDSTDPNPLTPNADSDLAPYGAPDGIINAADLLIAQQIVLGTITPTAQDIIHADIYPEGSPDGVINMSDFILLKQMILNPAL